MWRVVARRAASRDPPPRTAPSTTPHPPAASFLFPPLLRSSASISQGSSSPAADDELICSFICLRGRRWTSWLQLTTSSLQSRGRPQRARQQTECCRLVLAGDGGRLVISVRELRPATLPPRASRSICLCFAAGTGRLEHGAGIGRTGGDGNRVLRLAKPGHEKTRWASVSSEPGRGAVGG